MEGGGNMLHRNVQRGGRVFKAQRLCVSLKSRLERKEKKEEGTYRADPRGVEPSEVKLLLKV